MGEDQVDVSDVTIEGSDAAAVSWWRRRVPLWLPLLLLVALVAAVASLGAQLSSKDSDIEDLEAALDQERETVRRVQGESETLQKELDETTGELDRETARADEAEEVALEDAEAKLADRVAAADERETALDEREADLTGREQQLDATIAGMRASEFGDGVHQVGRDIQAGRYHTDGGGGTCYYALLGQDGRDILDNNLLRGSATVIINSPFFETKGCGTWTKVG